MDERQRELARQLIVEFIGTFALIFFGAGSIIVTQNSNLVAIALAHGLAIGLMVATAGHISGGLYNPALTVGVVATRRMPLPRGVAYIIIQLVGAVVAALALKTIFHGSQIDPVNLGAPAVATITSSAAVLAEFIGAFFLMYAVFGTAVDTRGAKAIAGLVIGLVITMSIFAFGPATGAALNPARSFGPELAQGFWSDWWVYWIGPILGALAAALLYEHVLMGAPITPEAGHVEVEPTTAQREARTVRRRRR